MSTSSLIESSIRELVGDFDAEYWRQHDQEKTIPEEFYHELAANDWFGMLVPEEYGGSEFGMETAAKIIEATANEGAGANANIFVLTSVMGSILFREFGTDAQKERYLPGLADGKYIMSWGITEPGAGSNTLATGTTAEYDDGGYRIDGKKVWTTFAHCSNLLIAVVRTTPLDEVERRTDGISLVALNPEEADNVEINRIEKMPIRATGSNEVFFKDTWVPEDQLIGEPDEGWNYLTDLLNVERIGSGALCVGTGKLALEKATAYATDREVFEQPIGAHQGIQHLLAEAKMNLALASRMSTSRHGPTRKAGTTSSKRTWAG